MLETMARLGYPQAGPIEDVQTPKKGQPGYRNVLGSIKTINRTKGVRKVFIALLFGDTESREGFSQLAGEAVHLGQGNYFLVGCSFNSVNRSRS